MNRTPRVEVTTQPRPIRHVVCPVCGYRELSAAIPPRWLVVDHSMVIACPECAERIYRRLLMLNVRANRKEADK